VNDLLWCVIEINGFDGMVRRYYRQKSKDKYKIPGQSKWYFDNEYDAKTALSLLNMKDLNKNYAKSFNNFIVEKSVYKISGGDLHEYLL